MNITVKQIEYKSTNGLNTIFGWLYIPAGEMRGIVQICHGMSEHMGRYHDFMRFLAQHGYVACGVDHIGHGRSSYENKFGWFGEKDGWRTLIEDQYKFHKIVHSEVPFCERSVLLGHSMGSFVTRLYAMKYPSTLSGMILSGTARSGLKVELAQRAAARSVRKYGPGAIDRDLNRMVFGPFLKGFQPWRTKSDWLSRDTAWVDQYVSDERCGFLFTSAGFYDLFTLVSRSNDRSCFEGARKELPILLFAGTMDPVGEYGKGPSQVYERYRKAGVRDVELKLYEGGRHEMLGEVNREQVYGDLLGWLNAHLPMPEPRKEEGFPEDAEFE